MEYFKILQFNREPFSNSPDPRFFYKSVQHVTCLQRLEVALRLRRGLNVVLGKVGTGKTTLCRRIMANFDGDHAIEAHFIFDPFFGTAIDFLLAVAQLFRCAPAENGANEWQVKEQIRHFLFRKGVEEGKTVIVIIDEGQKIPPFCLEILREFLNYETNDSKLLQIVIFAQTEFESTLKAHPNFSDRVNLLLRLEPLSFKDTRQMIAFRLDKASERGKAGIRFTYPAMRAIHRATQGYPRKIVNLCHRIILALIIQNKRTAGLSLVRSCIEARSGGSGRRYLAWAPGAGLAAAFALWAVIEHGAVLPQKASPSPTVPAPVRIAVERLSSHRQEGPVSQPSLAEKSPEKAAFAASPTPAERYPVGPIRSPAPEGAPPGAAPSAMSATSSPSEVGRIKVRRKDMVSTMIARLYGDFTVERMLKVAEANPHIPDINRIETGQVIVFPVLGAGKSEEIWRGGVIRLLEAASLEDAYRFVQGWSKYEPVLRVLCTWEAKKGTSYHVVFSHAYVDESTARAALAKLPPELSGRGEVLQGFGPGSLILAP